MSSIADIIRQGGRDQAEIALRQADIEAQRQQQRAATTGRAFATIADIAGSLPEQFRRERLTKIEEGQHELERQQSAAQLAQSKNLLQGQESVNQIMASLRQQPDGARTIDRGMLQQKFAEANVPLQLQSQTFKALDEIDGSLSAFQQARVEHGADFANSLLTAVGEHPIAPEMLTFMGAVAKANGLVDDTILGQIDAAVAKGADPKVILQQFRGLSKKYQPKFETLAPGAGIYNATSGQVVTPPADKPKTQAALAVDAADMNSPTHEQSAAALALLKPTTPSSMQSKDVLLNGKPAVVTFDAKNGTGKYYDVNGKDVTSQVAPIPPASAGGGSGAGLDPDAVSYTATQYRILGPSGIPTRIEGPDRVKILNEAAKQAKSLGQSPVQAVQKQAAYKADASSLTKMTAMRSAAEAFETKALAQADIVEGLSDKVGRTSVPLINAALLAGKAQIGGDADTQLLYNALTTFTTEYAKLMGGATGSAQASTDSARREAASLISAALNKGTVRKTLGLMRQEMALTMQGYDATIAHITERMGGTPAASEPAAVVPPPARSTTPGLNPFR